MTNLNDAIDKCEGNLKKSSLASKILDYTLVIGGLFYFASMVYFGSKPAEDSKPKVSTHSVIQNYKQAVHDLDSGYK